jgi:ABC-type amino acid transport substrate-binding protein
VACKSIPTLVIIQGNEMNFKLIIMTIAICVGIVSYFLLLALFKTPKKKNTLMVGTAAGYAPFVSINNQGVYEGFDIDVAQAIADTLGKQLVVRDMGSMSSLFMALEQGSIDVIIWGLSITQDRLKRVAMINYQGEVTTAYSLLFWEAIPATIHSIKDMKGATICVEPASSQAQVLEKYTFITPLYTEKVDDALLNIMYGKADAALVEPAIAKKFMNKYAQIKMLPLPLTPEDQVEGIGIAVKKNNISLINDIQCAVSELKQKGIIKQYEMKWNVS